MKISPPPEKRHKVDEEEEGPEGYGIFEGRYDYGDSIFPPDDDDEDALFGIQVMFHVEDDTPDEKIDAYLKQIADSEGFDLEDSPDAFYGSIRPVDLGLRKISSYLKQIAESEGVEDLERYKKEYEDIIKDEFLYIMKCLDVAIAKNNADSVKPKLKLVSLKKANCSGCAGVVYYITFVAKHVTSGKNFTFQAKVLGRQADKVEVEGPEGYSVFEGKYDYGDSIFSGIGDGVDEEDGLYTLYVMFSDNGIRHPEKVSAYLKEIAETEGFDIDDSPDAFIGSIIPLDLQLHELDCQKIMKCLDYAIAQNNADPVKPKLGLVTVKKANFSPCDGRIYYITFVAKDVDSQKNYTFQAKVHSGIRGCEMGEGGSLKHVGVDYWEEILELR
ncbi:hypothetical protein Tsubulata_045580 [Turnera subulata]|uniref:Cystatin domain-containing protein n=1 Tax=Turnera subulata TaxID=218843 RepID=A0A9Q0G388_9ROSI|nr:hypothetical protein Tsubulata_045580 [Turnera subulata]